MSRIWSEDGAHDQLRAAILNQRLKPGTRLKEDELIEVFGLSRAKVRNILVRLSRERVVTIERNKGAWVSKPSRAEAREIFAVRRVVEALVVELAAMRWTPEASRRVRAQLESEAEATRCGDETRAIVLAGEFHVVLADIAGTSFLRSFVEQLVAQSSLISAAYETGRRHECEHGEHLRIVELVEKGDTVSAAELMRRHIEGIEQRHDLDWSEEPQPSLKEILSAT